MILEKRPFWVVSDVQNGPKWPFWPFWGHFGLKWPFWPKMAILGVQGVQNGVFYMGVIWSLMCIKVTLFVHILSEGLEGCFGNVAQKGSQNGSFWTSKMTPQGVQNGPKWPFWPKSAILAYFGHFGLKYVF